MEIPFTTRDGGVFPDSRVQREELIQNIVALADLATFNTQHPWQGRLK